MIDEYHCCCCGGAAVARPGATVGGFQLLACEQCGFEHYANPQSPVTSGGSLYELDEDYRTDALLGSNHRRMLQWHHYRVLSFLQRFPLPAAAATLDIGCHTGFFVRELLDRGIDAAGIDSNVSALEHGLQAYRLTGRLSNSTLDEIHLEGKRFDLISALEVLEHVQQPDSLLDQMVRLLKPNGLLAVSVPNKGMLWRPPLDYPPHHLSRFTAGALRSLILARGVRILLHNEQMSVFDLARHFAGARMRNARKRTLRGGEFRFRATSIHARRFLNLARPIANIALSPLDAMLHAFGLRYIGQLVIARA